MDFTFLLQKDEIRLARVTPFIRVEYNSIDSGTLETCVKLSALNYLLEAFLQRIILRALHLWSHQLKTPVNSPHFLK